MKLSDLDQDERLALVALVKGIVLADGDVSDAEAEILPGLAEAIGKAAYHETFTEVGQRFSDEDGVKKFLLGITRPEARELIYQTVANLATVDGVSPGERYQLKWLEGAWGLKAGGPS